MSKFWVSLGKCLGSLCLRFWVGLGFRSRFNRVEFGLVTF